MPNSFAAAYRAAMAFTGGTCPIEAGVIGYLADHECRHGRLPGDAGPPCSCWPDEPGNVVGHPTAAPARSPDITKAA
jgi:hypothetical protein